MSNFIGLVYATLKAKGIDYSTMSVSEAVDKFNELKGNTDKQKKAESEHKSGVLDEIREKSLSHSKYSSYGNSGYQGGMSKRAVSAYEDGEMPYSKWSKSAIIEAVLEYNDKLTEKDLNRLSAGDLRAMFLEQSSWHHTGKYFNKTDFYSIDKDKAEKLTREDIYSQLASEHFSKAISDEQAKTEWDKLGYKEKYLENDIKELSPILDKIKQARYEQRLAEYNAQKEVVGEFWNKHPNIKELYEQYKDMDVKQIDSRQKEGLYYAFNSNDFERLTNLEQPKKEEDRYGDGTYKSDKGAGTTLRELENLIHSDTPTDIKAFIGKGGKAGDFSKHKKEQANKIAEVLLKRANNPYMVTYARNNTEQDLEALADYINRTENKLK